MFDELECRSHITYPLICFLKCVINPMKSSLNAYETLIKSFEIKSLIQIELILHQH